MCDCHEDYYGVLHSRRAGLLEYICRLESLITGETCFAMGVVCLSFRNRPCKLNILLNPIFASSLPVFFFFSLSLSLSSCCRFRLCNKRLPKSKNPNMINRWVVPSKNRGRILPRCEPLPRQNCGAPSRDTLEKSLVCTGVETRVF